MWGLYGIGPMWFTVYLMKRQTSYVPGLGIASRVVFLPNIIQFGRVTSDVVWGTSVTQSVRGWAHS